MTRRRPAPPSASRRPELVGVSSAASAGPGDAPAPATLVITGMHRSATSLMASLCQSAGLHIGDDLMPANTGNELGHFEDLEFYEFHKRALRANGCCQDGFVPNAVVVVPPLLREEASRLVVNRHSRGVPWGWKDPRTVLFLGFWRELLPRARYVFMFRSPWEVVDSLYRRGVHEFLHTNPSSALAIWTRYNRDILDFATRHPDRCLLLSASRLIADPAAAVATVERRLGIPLTAAAPLCRRESFTPLVDSPREAFVRRHATDAVALYEELLAIESPERARQSPAARNGDDECAHGLLELGMRDWFQDHEQPRRIAHAESIARDAVAARDDLVARLAAVECEAEGLRAHVARLEHERALSAADRTTAGGPATHDALSDDVCDLRNQFVALAASVEHRSQAVEAIARTADDLREGLGGVQQRLVALETTLEQSVVAMRLLEGTLRDPSAMRDALENIHSWQIARPLRNARRWLIRLCRRALDQVARIGGPTPSAASPRNGDLAERTPS